MFIRIASQRNISIHRKSFTGMKRKLFNVCKAGYVRILLQWYNIRKTLTFQISMKGEFMFILKMHVSFPLSIQY